MYQDKDFIRHSLEGKYFVLTHFGDELMHYGRKGMKWGQHIYGKEEDINSMDRRKLIGIISSGRDIYLQKGQEVHRITNTEHETLPGKKYASLRKEDVGMNLGLVMEETGTFGADVYHTIYKTSKPMKIAGNRVQSQILEDMYGRTITKKFKKDLKKMATAEQRNRLKSIIQKPISEMTDDEFSTYFYYNPFGYDYDILNKPSTNSETSKFMKKLSNKGYSAVVDMADTSISYSDAPVVILNAENSLELKSNNLKWSSRYDGWVD